MSTQRYRVRRIDHNIMMALRTTWIVVVTLLIILTNKNYFTVALTSVVATNKKMASSSSSWRQKCQQDFGLVELPKECEQLSQANDESWKRYHQYRTQIEQDASMEEEDDDDGKARVLKKMHQALQQEADDVHCPQWLAHTFQNVDNVQLESDTEFRSITTCATLFSPFLVPHAVKLQHTYHYRPQSDWCEFYCNWHFSLERFDGNLNGDGRQQQLAQIYPADTILLNSLYNAEEGMEVLCSNGYMNPPRTLEQVDWIPIEDTFVDNFTPHTVQRIRGWLCLSTATSNSSMSDFDFLRLLFASYGTPNFETFCNDEIGVGHVWSPSLEVQDQLNLNDTGDADNTNLNWLEYQARLVSGALRPHDKYYEPFDVQAKKAEWGRRVLQVCQPPSKYSIDEDEDLNQTPWLVWERAQQSATNMQQAMQAMTQLGYYRQ